VTASITAKPLTVTGITANNRVYDSTTSATALLVKGAAALSGVIGGDTVTLDHSGATATFANKNIGPSKTITIAGGQKGTVADLAGRLRKDALRGGGTRPHRPRNMSKAAGPLIRMMAIAAGGAPLDSAKIVSALFITKLLFVVLVQARHCRLGTRFNQLLKQLQAHLPHGRDLLSQLLQLVNAPSAVHKVGNLLDISVICFCNIGKSKQRPSLFRGTIDFNVHLHGPRPPIYR
jgi:hypothetical protein